MKPLSQSQAHLQAGSFIETAQSSSIQPTPSNQTQAPSSFNLGASSASLPPTLANQQPQPQPSSTSSQQQDGVKYTVEKLAEMKQKALRKQQMIEAHQQFRLQELKEALVLEDKPDAIIIHKYTKKVVLRRGPRKQQQNASGSALEGVANNSENPLDDQDLTRASKFRGVSKNGVQWQVSARIKYFNIFVLFIYF